jgi:hypothetical protein
MEVAMNTQTKKSRGSTAVTVGLFAGMLLLAAQAAWAARNPNPGVLPPQSHAFGATYGEWNARWWQWALSMPVDAHPLFDTADCSAGQSGHVWFLGSTFSATPDPGDPDNAIIGTAERDCTVPTGKALFHPYP